MQLTFMFCTGLIGLIVTITAQICVIWGLKKKLLEEKKESLKWKHEHIIVMNMLKLFEVENEHLEKMLDSSYEMNTKVVKMNDDLEIQKNKLIDLAYINNFEKEKKTNEKKNG